MELKYNDLIVEKNNIDNPRLLRYMVKRPEKNIILVEVICEYYHYAEITLRDNELIYGKQAIITHMKNLIKYYNEKIIGLTNKSIETKKNEQIDSKIKQLEDQIKITEKKESPNKERAIKEMKKAISRLNKKEKNQINLNKQQKYFEIKHLKANIESCNKILEYLGEKT